MAANLDELVQYIRETLPQPKQIVHLRTNDQAGVVSFGWNGRDFVVKPTMEVYELKNEHVFITGSSMLMQLALLLRNKNEKTLAAVVGTLQQAEDMISNPMNRKKGLSLLQAVKATLKRLVR